MVCNPNRKAMGGDVDGTEATDPANGVTIKPLQVSKASFDPGYAIGHVKDDYGLTQAEIKVGYSSYGRNKIGNGKS